MSVRASSHNGRFGSAKHNGRDFDLSKAEHVKPSMTEHNRYWSWDKGPCDGCGLAESELSYYEQMFSDSLAKQNEKHLSRRQNNRTRTMDQVIKTRQKCPEESILQIGNMKDGVSAGQLVKCYNEYLKWQNQWSKAHGEPFKILDAAVHLDESSPHVHQRRVWQYKDVDGTWHIGQNKALAAAGVPLPDPSKKEGPKNNRKMTFDAMAREQWISICEKHGFQIERTPLPNQSHLPKEAFIELEERKAALEARETALAEQEALTLAKSQKAEKREAELNKREKQLEDREALILAKEQRVADREAQLTVRAKQLEEREEDVAKAQAANEAEKQRLFGTKVAKQHHDLAQKLDVPTTKPARTRTARPLPNTDDIEY